MNSLERPLFVLLGSSLSIYSDLSLTKPNLFWKYVNEMVCKYQITECWEVTCLGVKTFPLRDGVGSCNPNVECKVPAHSDAQQITALNYWVPMLKTWIITIVFSLFKSLTLFSLLCYHCQFLYKSIIFYLIYWRETWRQ